MIKLLGRSFRRHGKPVALPVLYRATIALVPGIVALAVAIGAALAIHSLERWHGLATHAQKVLVDTRALTTVVVSAEANYRGFRLLGDSSFLLASREAEKSAMSLLRSVRDATNETPEQRERVAKLDSLVRLRFQLFTISQAMFEAGDIAKVLQSVIVETHVTAQLRDVATQIEEDEQQRLLKHDSEERQSKQFALLVVLVGGCLSVVVSLIATRMLADNIREIEHANHDLLQQATQLEGQASELKMQATTLESTANELEAANSQLQQQRDLARLAQVNAEHANAAKARFLSTMSHELRTPLNAVSGYVDLMDAEVHGPINELQRVDLQRIKRAVSHLTMVISEILGFAKLEAGAVQFNFSPLPMVDALENSKALMEPQAAAKNIQLTYNHSCNDLVSFADRDRVQQILLNLISNAIKYTKPDGTVSVSCALFEGQIRVTVGDNGNGIPVDDLERIFEPFVQLSQTAHSPSDGVGLGLAISRDLARGMGGDITVTSEVNRGSAFELVLPQFTSVKQNIASLGYSNEAYNPK